MRILLTGGAGFVGSNLAMAARAAFPAADVVCIDNLYRRGSDLNLPRLAQGGVQFHLGDVRNPGEFPAGPFDVLVECSAEPSVLAGQDGSPDYLFQTNMVGAYQCLEKARLWKSRFLFLSTSRVYPVARLEAHPFREEATRFSWEEHGTPGISSRGVSENLEMTGARSLYGFTKLAAEQLIEEYRAAFGLETHGFQVEQAVPRFLPYTMARGSQPPVFLIRAYLAIPPAWPVFGKQFLVIARK